MSVVVQTLVQIRPFSGYNDPRFPIGYWAIQEVATGDATGGLVGITGVFMGVTDPLNSQMYSLEQMALTASGGGSSTIGEVLTVNMDSLRALTTGLFQAQVRLELGTAGIQSLAFGANPHHIGAFLGRPANTGTTAGITFRTANVNGLNLVMVMQGYVWGPRSVLAEGGPQRPPQGLYR